MRHDQHKRVIFQWQDRANGTTPHRLPDIKTTSILTNAAAQPNGAPGAYEYQKGHTSPTTKNRGHALFSTLHTIHPDAHNLAQASPNSAFTTVPTYSTGPDSH